MVNFKKNTHSMRQIIGLAMVALVSFASCKKDKSDVEIPSGTYKGTFARVGAARWEPPAEVTLTFNGNQYAGQATAQYYPAVCNGTFSVSGNSANFKNACFWTANFDWTLVLDGDYEIETRGDSLFITRSYPGTILQIDKYKLKRQ
jgi:hypothetical protein